MQWPRVEYVGAFYQVICRDNQRQVIFRSDADREYYLEGTVGVPAALRPQVYAYVLMSNHRPLADRSRQGCIVKITQGLQLRYTGC